VRYSTSAIDAIRTHLRRPHRGELYRYVDVLPISVGGMTATATAALGEGASPAVVGVG
jgi:hypothetical protein